MEAVGFAAGVVGVATAALASSRALYEMVDEVRNAPDELSAISKDVHSLHDVITSIQLALRDTIVVKVLQEDRQLCDRVTRLESPMLNCTTMMSQLKLRIEPHLKMSSSGSLRFSSIDIRWGFKKKDIIECRNRLEATKSTLNAALASIVFFCSLRSAGQNTDNLPSLSPDLAIGTSTCDVDAGSVLIEYAESIEPRSPPVSAIADTTMDPVELMANTPIPMPTSWVEAIDPEEFYRDHVIDPQKGIEKKDVNAIDALLKQGRDVNRRNTDGETLLHWAAVNGKTDVVRFLILHNADVNARRTRDGRTPLHCATSGKHKHIVEILLALGADVTARDCDNISALQLSLGLKGTDTCVAGADEDTAMLLLRRGSPLLSAEDLRAPLKLAPPLLLAIWAKLPRVVEAMLERGRRTGQLLDMLGSHDDTPIFIYAIREGSIEMVRILLNSCANINGRDSIQRTPLMIAAGNGQLDIMWYLIEQGADRQAKSKNGRQFWEFLKQNHPDAYAEHFCRVRD